MKVACALKPLLVLLIALPGAPLVARAQHTVDDGRPMPIPLPLHDHATAEIDSLMPAVLARARALGLSARPASAPQVERNDLRPLEFPLRLRPPGRGGSPFAIANFVDLDQTPSLQDWACGRRSIDGHGGIDFFMFPFWWWLMDQGLGDIVAAAPGVITFKRDGNDDRICEGSSVSPPPSNPISNMIFILQDDGLTAVYTHMKTGSMTTKAIGERVVTGETLGKVGSSGNSGGPHLHFELRDPTGIKVEPFAGACNPGKTLWKHQWGANANFRIVQVATHDAPPVFAPACPASGRQDGTDSPNYQDQFSPGEIVHTGVYTRDWDVTDRVTGEIFRPDGTLAWSYSSCCPATFRPATASIRSYALPGDAPAGTWRLRGATPAGQVVEHSFFVTGAPGRTNLVGAVLPSGRSIRTNSVATVFATIINAGSQPAEGCWIQPETPLNALFSFQATDPATNAVTGSPNKSVTIGSGVAQSFVLTFIPDPSTNAQGVNTRLRFKCTNADAAPVFDAVNTLLLSFDANPVPEIIPIAATPSNDGIVRIPGIPGSQSWSAASTNIGLTSTLTVAPQVTGTSAIRVVICKTNPSTAACLSAPTESVDVHFETNTIHTFSLFVNAADVVSFDPANTRINLTFTDVHGLIRGRTGVAVMTQ